jgi:hypothetical protein
MHGEEEVEMTAFLRRLAPGFEKQCVAATTGQIDRLERIAGRPLPAFYHWFLRTMGRDIGPFAKARQDLSIDSILSAYDEGLVEPDSRLLLIATDTDEDDPTLGFYDLDDPDRDDASVLIGRGFGGHLDRTYETFREMFAQSNLIAFRIRESPRYCRGSFTDPDQDVSTKLERIMVELGFASVVPTGAFCKVLERADSAMVGWRSPSEDRRHLMFFNLGGEDEPAVRRLLGEIATATAFEIKIDQWGPSPR